MKKGPVRIPFQAAVARLTGLEPATPGVTGRYSNQLSYNRPLRSAGIRASIGLVKPCLRKILRAMSLNPPCLPRSGTARRVQPIMPPPGPNTSS